MPACTCLARTGLSITNPGGWWVPANISHLKWSPKQLFCSDCNQCKNAVNLLSDRFQKLENGFENFFTITLFQHSKTALLYFLRESK